MRGVTKNFFAGAEYNCKTVALQIGGLLLISVLVAASVLKLRDS